MSFEFLSDFKFMKVKFYTLLVFFICACSKDKDEPKPANFLTVTINGSSHTFIGRSIYEPTEIFADDTLEKTTYLGGNIGNYIEGNTAFIDVRIPGNTTGTFSLSGGLSFWVQLEDFALTANERDLDDHEITVVIEEYGDMDGRVSGSFSGNRSGEYPAEIFGEFSLRRLPDNTLTLEVIKELCPELYPDYD